MDELITSVCSQVGVDEAVAKQAIGAILCFLKEQVADTKFDFDKVTSKLKGAIDLMNEAPKTKEEAKLDREMDESSGGTDESTTPRAAATGTSSFNIVALIQWILTAGPLLEILKKLLRMFFGEGAVQMLTSASETADLTAILSNLGVSQEMAKKMVPILVKYMKEKLGPETVDQLAENVPALKPFLDASKKEE